jgi:hypothetical protein
MLANPVCSGGAAVRSGDASEPLGAPLSSRPAAVPRSAARALALAFGWGSVASSLCTTAHPLHTISTNIFGAFFSEGAVRPSPNLQAAGRLRGRLGPAEPQLRRGLAWRAAAQAINRPRRRAGAVERCASDGC